MSKILLCLALLALPMLAQPALAGEHSSYINIINHTTGGVWVTAYRGKTYVYPGPMSGGLKPHPNVEPFIVTAYCAAAGAGSGRNIAAHILWVRLEVTKTANCAHPVVLNRYLEYPVDASTQRYLVMERDGKYTAEIER